MRYFSLVAFAEGEASLPGHQVLLDRGMNVFSVFTDDIDTVVEELKTQRVRVDKICPLDEFESVPPPSDEPSLKTLPFEGGEAEEGS